MLNGEKFVGYAQVKEQMAKFEQLANAKAKELEGANKPSTSSERRRPSCSCACSSARRATSSAAPSRRCAR